MTSKPRSLQVLGDRLLEGDAGVVRGDRDPHRCEPYQPRFGVLVVPRHTLRVPLDPRTPVIVGVGQVTSRPTPDDASDLDRAARADGRGARAARGTTRAGARGVRSSLLERIDELTAIPSFVWTVPDPARAVADALGLSPASTRVTFAGGTVPQVALFDAARRIAAGELDVAAIVGAEAMKSRDLARRAGGRAAWHEQSADVAAAPVAFEVARARSTTTSGPPASPFRCTPTPSSSTRSAALTACRASSTSRGSDALATRMSAVAVANHHAWLRDTDAALTASTPTAANRMVSFPYTKLLTSNVVVDMGAAVVVCSLEAARAAGVPDDQLVFPSVVRTRSSSGSSRRARAVPVPRDACVRSRPCSGRSRRPPTTSRLLDLYSCFPCRGPDGAATRWASTSSATSARPRSPAA